MYAVIFLSACVHEYIIALAFGYFYPILFIQFAILGCKFFRGFNFFKKKRDFFFKNQIQLVISMLILPQRTQNNAFNVFIWASLFVGLGMQMCLYSIEWYARQNCPRYVVSQILFCTK
jgi:sterol O-acyltransferase